MANRHKKLLHTLLSGGKTPRNLLWKEAKKAMEAVGVIIKNRNGSARCCEFNGASFGLHKPHGAKAALKPYQIRDIVNGLRDGGLTRKALI